MITVYGIKNCDTVKKARKWLEAESIAYTFHDFREDGTQRKAVEQWVAELGWENVINKRSTSWKALDTATRESMDAKTAVAAIMQQPTLIKRPLLDTGKSRHTGFSVPNYTEIFS